MYGNEKIIKQIIADGHEIGLHTYSHPNFYKCSEEEIRKLSVYYKELNKKQEKCLQKVGIVRYNAYKDTGSDLSFAVCLLDEKNDGIVFNGIYSRDMSNIYAKPIHNGESRYKVTPEESEAILKAMNMQID